MVPAARVKHEHVRMKCMNRGIVKDKNMAAFYDWLLTLSISDFESLNNRLWDFVCKYYPEKKDQQYRIT